MYLANEILIAKHLLVYEYTDNLNTYFFSTIPETVIYSEPRGENGINPSKTTPLEMSKTPRLVYLLTHTPVHYHRPLQVGFREKAQWSDELFKKYMEGVEENRKAGCGRHYLSKRDIER